MDNTTHDIAIQLRRGVMRLSRRLRLAATDSLSPGQISVLGLLDKYQSLTPGEIAAHEGVRPPSMTPLIKSLHAAQLVTCLQDQSDRRSTRVALTSQGRRELNTIRRRRTEFLERKLLTLSSVEREKAQELVAFLDTLLEDS